MEANKFKLTQELAYDRGAKGKTQIKGEKFRTRTS